MYRKRKIVIAYYLEVSTRRNRSCYATPFKIEKMIWFGELSDADLFTPSCPHLHSLGGKYKLNVYTGEIYDIRTRSVLRNKYVSDEELLLLWNDTSFYQFATKMRAIYNEKYPDSALPAIPPTNRKDKIKQARIVRMNITTVRTSWNIKTLHIQASTCHVQKIPT